MEDGSSLICICKISITPEEMFAGLNLINSIELYQNCDTLEFSAPSAMIVLFPWRQNISHWFVSPGQTECPVLHGTE